MIARIIGGVLASLAKLLVTIGIGWKLATGQAAKKALKANRKVKDERDSLRLDSDKRSKLRDRFRRR